MGICASMHVMSSDVYSPNNTYKLMSQRRNVLEVIFKSTALIVANFPTMDVFRSLVLQSLFDLPVSGQVAFKAASDVDQDQYWGKERERIILAKSDQSG